MTDEHRTIRVIESKREWNRFAQRYTCVSRPRIIKLPRASFKVSKDGQTGNNSSKLKLLTFLYLVSIARIDRGFTNSEICARTGLKYSYLSCRGALLTKWGYVTRKDGPNGVLQYRVGLPKAERFLGHAPVAMFESFGRYCTQNNPDLFGSQILKAKKPDPQERGVIKVDTKTLRRFKALTWNPGRGYHDHPTAEENIP